MSKLTRSADVVSGKRLPPARIVPTIRHPDDIRAPFSRKLRQSLPIEPKPTPPDPTPDPTSQPSPGAGKIGDVNLGRVAWLLTVLACLVAVCILVLEGYYGYAGVTFAVALSAAINLV